MFILEWLQLRAKLNFEVLRSALLCVRVWRCGKGPKNQVEICPSQDNIESSDIIIIIIIINNAIQKHAR